MVRLAPINSAVLTKVLADQSEGIVYTSGYTAGFVSGTDILMRAYDPVTGTKLWEAGDKGADDFPQDIAVGLIKSSSSLMAGIHRSTFGTRRYYPSL